MSSRKKGTCTACHTRRTLVAKGMCSACYQRQLRGVPDVDCFALDLHSKRGQCQVMEGNCRLHKGHPCPFHRTHAEYSESITKSLERINSLPDEQRRHIVEKYLMQEEP